MKGSTNHDDAALFVVLGLFVAIAIRGRALGGGVVVGLLLGAGVGYYLDALFPALGIVAVVLLAGPDRGRRAVGLVMGGTLALLAAYALGVRPFDSPAVREALARSQLAETQPLLARVSLLANKGIADVVAMPDPLGYGALRVAGGRLASSAYLAALALMALAGPLAGRGLPGASLVRTGAAAALLLSLAAVAASGVDPAYAGYVAPAVVYAFVLAAAGAPSGASSSGRRLPGRAAWALYAGGAAAAVLIGLGGGVFGLVDRMRDEDRRAQARVANGLTAARVHSHTVGSRLVLPLSHREVEALAAARPRERAALRRIAGWQLALTGGYPRDVDTVRTRVLAGTRPAADDLDGWEGVGEGIARALRMVPAIDEDPDKLPRVLAELLAFPPLAPPASDAEFRLRFGAMLELFAWASGRLDALVPALENDAFHAPTCRALGGWAYAARRPHRLSEVPAATGRCDRAAVAAGWGEGLARDLLPPGQLPVDDIHLAWFWNDTDARSEGAMRAALRAEGDRLRRLSAP